MSKYTVHLCKNCFNEVTRAWVYKTPVEQTEIIVVENPAECDNYNLDEYEQKLKTRNPEY